jgi:hypothetical protein
MGLYLTTCFSPDATFTCTVPELKFRDAGISCKTKLQSKLNLFCYISQLDTQIKNKGCKIRVTGDKLNLNILPNHTLVAMALYSTVLLATQQNISFLLLVW